MQKRRKKVPAAVLLRHPVESPSFKAAKAEKTGIKYQFVIKPKDNSVK